MTEETLTNFGSKFFTNGFFSFLIHGLIAWLIAITIVSLLKRAMHKASKISNDRRNIQMKYVYLTLRFIIYAFALFFVLSDIRVLSNLGKTLLGATSILAVGVSLAAQETFSNYISGFFLAMYQPFQVGDFITLNEKNISGSVQEITFRHTVLHTVDNTTLIIPNSVMNSAIIEDKASTEVTYVKWMSVGVAYDSDVEKVKQIIRQVVSSHPGFIDERTAEEKKAGKEAIVVRLDSFENSSLLMKFRLVCKDYGSSWQIASDIRESILEEFRKNGIVIPYPIYTIQQGDQ